MRSIYDRIFVMGICCCLSVLCGCMATDTGSLSVHVMDGWNDQPIEKARVVIPETGDVRMTDAHGCTTTIRVPVLYDRHFTGILPQDWGTVTVLVYADGYYPCVLYGVCVEKDVSRENLKIRLFPGDGSLGDTPYLLVESPDSGWVAELLRRYGP